MKPARKAPKRSPAPSRPLPRPTPSPMPMTLPLDETPATWSDLIGTIAAGDEDLEVHVYQEPERGGRNSGERAAWCFMCAPDDYPSIGDLFQRIKDDPEFGPGTYSLRLRYPGETTWKGGKRVAIAGRRRPPGAAAAPAATMAPGAPDVLAEMRAMQTRNDERYMGLLEKLALRPAGDGGLKLTDVIAITKLLADGKGDPIQQLKAVLSLRDELIPAGAGEDGEAGSAAVGANMTDLAIKALDTFGPAIAQLSIINKPAIAPSPEVVPVAPAAIAGAAGGAGVAPPATPAAAPKPQQNPLMPLIGMLLRAAAADGDPETFADAALTLINNDELAAGLLANEDPVALLEEMAPPVKAHRPWFEQVIAHARELMQPPSEGGEGNEGESP